MIQLLFTLLAAEPALALLFRTPIRRLALLAIDCAKRGRGPVMAKTVAGTMLLVLVSAGYSIAKICRRAGELGQLTPTDQALLAVRSLLQLTAADATDLKFSVLDDSLNTLRVQLEDDGDEEKGSRSPTSITPRSTASSTGSSRSGKSS